MSSNNFPGRERKFQAGISYGREGQFLI